MRKRLGKSVKKCFALLGQDGAFFVVKCGLESKKSKRLDRGLSPHFLSYVEPPAHVRNLIVVFEEGFP